MARAEIAADELVVDLGAGTGALTEALLRAGARVVSIELHAGRAALLQRRFGQRGAQVVVGDLLRVPLPAEPFRVVANPPWDLADSILGRLRRSAHCRRADLVLPRWQVRRWSARHADVAQGLSIRAESFRPTAPYGAAVAIVKPRSGPRP